MVAYWAGLGWRLSPGTLGGSLAALVPLWEPLYAALRGACRQDRQWLMDETRLAVFAELAGQGSARWWR